MPTTEKHLAPQHRCQPCDANPEQLPRTRSAASWCVTVPGCFPAAASGGVGSAPAKCGCWLPNHEHTKSPTHSQRRPFPSCQFAAGGYRDLQTQPHTAMTTTIRCAGPNRLAQDSSLGGTGSTLSQFTYAAGGNLTQGGRVGGLLAITDASQGSHFCAYDGNGNVAALVKADGAGLTAQYEYGPFGELLRATGPMAKANPFRFSTKYQDDESDLLYYGYRYYNPNTGRWPNRDPLEEQGGRNLYGFIHNNPLTVVDADGLAEFPRIPTTPSFPTIPTIPSFPWPHPLPPPTKPPTAPPSLPCLLQISLPSLCLFNPFHAGSVNFVGFNQSALNNFRVFPETGTTMTTPSSGWNSKVDGFWWRNSRQWFKIPDHCHCTITATPTADLPSAFKAECCCNACVHAGLTAYRDWKNDPRPTKPDFYPDEPPTNHGTDYPFENEQ